MCLVTAVSVVGVACYIPPPVEGSIPAAAAEQLREYNGVTLSSIEDLRENSYSGPRHVDPSTYRLTVSGLVEHELELSYDEVIRRYPVQQRVVTLQCEEGWEATLLWEGVRVSSLLDEAVVRPEAKVVIFRSADRYSTSLFLDYLYGTDILMAHKINGVRIPYDLGFPFQLVAQGKWGYKWSKWITEIEVSDDIHYEGYWESEGFSNTGDAGKPALA